MNSTSTAAPAVTLCARVGAHAMARAYRACHAEHVNAAARRQAMVSAAVGAVRTGRQLLLGASQAWDAAAVQTAAMEQAIDMALQAHSPHYGPPPDSEQDVLAAYAAIVEEASRAG